MNKNSIEIKRKYVHKNYKYPNLYDDIVLLELGRRIIFDYDNVSFLLNDLIGNGWRVFSQLISILDKNGGNF